MWEGVEMPIVANTIGEIKIVQIGAEIKGHRAVYCYPFKVRKNYVAAGA